ncbi:MAG: GNAT family N-acetyltransferase [Mycobacteriales bacterium]
MPCRAGDVVLLEQWAPTGRAAYHAARFARQQQGTSSYLIAWLQGSPVGAAELKWEGCDAPQVRAALPDCPELSAIAVSPQLRSRGIGTALITHAEDLVRQRGLDQLGLGVDDTNERAAALYLRLGYAETGLQYLDRYHYITDDGVRHDVADPARFLVKRL